MRQDMTEEERLLIDERAKQKEAMMQEMMDLVTEYAPREREVSQHPVLSNLLPIFIASLFCISGGCMGSAADASQSIS